jgi:hypothetical protein
MTPRLVKQMLYGALYLGILALIIFGIYYFWFKAAATCSDGRQNQKETGIDCGGPCQSCEIAKLKPLTVSWTKYLPASENEVSLLAKIANPNLNFGSRNFSYQFEVIGPFGALLKKNGGQSFIYPGEEKYLMAPALKINSTDISQVKLAITTSTLIWQSKEELIRPDLDKNSIKTEIVNQTVKVSGLIKNKDLLLINQVRIIAILFDNQNKILNASYTAITNLKGLDEQPFIINFPKGDWIKDLDLHRTEIFLAPEPK